MLSTYWVWWHSVASWVGGESKHIWFEAIRGFKRCIYSHEGRYISLGMGVGKWYLLALWLRHNDGRNMNTGEGLAVRSASGEFAPECSEMFTDYGELSKEFTTLFRRASDSCILRCNAHFTPGVESCVARYPQRIGVHQDFLGHAPLAEITHLSVFVFSLQWLPCA